MASISYTVANEYFPTQRELVQRVSALLKSYHAPVQLSGADAALMHDLLLRHPSADVKVGCGVKAIWILRNRAFGNGFYIERIDGSFVDFSYKQCVRPFTHATKAKFAFRRAIEEQVLEVKQAAFYVSDTLICPVSGDAITWETAHVDHEPPLTFAALLEAYCGERLLDLDTIDLIEPASGIGKHLPPALVHDWASWHRMYARLRVISAEANIKLVR